MGIMDLLSSKTTYVRTPDKAISSFLPSTGVTPTAPRPVNRYDLAGRGVQVSDSDMAAFRPLLYGEVSNRAPDRQALEANVIFNTALNRVKAYGDRGQSKTLADVLAMPNQYQAYGGPQYRAYSNPTDPASLAKKRQVDEIVNAIHEQVKSGKYDDNTKGAYYYAHDPKTSAITYDNMRPLFAK